MWNVLLGPGKRGHREQKRKKPVASLMRLHSMWDRSKLTRNPLLWTHKYINGVTLVMRYEENMTRTCLLQGDIWTKPWLPSLVWCEDLGKACWAEGRAKVKAQSGMSSECPERPVWLENRGGERDRQRKCGQKANLQGWAAYQKFYKCEWYS